MWQSPEYLKLCEKLHTAGLIPTFKAGINISRGYADLGCEEFLLLSDNKLLSLVSGKQSELTEEHKKYFFLVPSIDQLVNLVLDHCAKIESISFVDERTWQVEFIDKSGASYNEKDYRLELALGRGLLRLLESNNVRSFTNSSQP